MFFPTARTIPLTSLPRIAGSFNGKSFCRAPDRIFQSMGFTLVAEIATSTKSAPIVGSGTLSSYFRFSGPPYSCKRTALTLLSRHYGLNRRHLTRKSRSRHLTAVGRRAVAKSFRSGHPHPLADPLGQLLLG